MSNAEHEPEYFSHVTLMFLGDDLDHRSVSRSLRLRPTQAWRKGESKPHGGSSFDWGVWKKAIPNAQLSQPLNRQLAFWVKALRGRAQTIKKLNNAGNLCARLAASLFHLVLHP